MGRVQLVGGPSAVRDGLALLLERESGLEVVGRAGSLAECRKLLSGGGGFDAAVVDLYLPDGDGAELVGKLRKANLRAAVLVLTESLYSEDCAKAREAGADEVFCKQTPLNWVIAAIRRSSRTSVDPLP
jgi:two-component system response regulator DevR